MPQLQGWHSTVTFQRQPAACWRSFPPSMFSNEPAPSFPSTKGRPPSASTPHFTDEKACSQSFLKDMRRGGEKYFTHVWRTFKCSCTASLNKETVFRIFYRVAATTFSRLRPLLKYFVPHCNCAGNMRATKGDVCAHSWKNLQTLQISELFFKFAELNSYL